MKKQLLKIKEWGYDLRLFVEPLFYAMIFETVVKRLQKRGCRSWLRHLHNQLEEYKYSRVFKRLIAYKD